MLLMKPTNTKNVYQIAAVRPMASIKYLFDTFFNKSDPDLLLFFDAFFAITTP